MTITESLSSPLNCQSQQLSSALSSACDFNSHFGKQCGPRSDCSSSRSSLIRVHTVWLCKSRFEKLARIFSRQHKQMTFSDAGFLGILRVKITNPIYFSFIFQTLQIWEIVWVFFYCFRIAANVSMRQWELYMYTATSL